MSASAAQREIDAVHDWQEEEGTTDATMIAGAIIAQAEATLELASQQKATNYFMAAAAMQPSARRDDMLTRARIAMGMIS